MTYLYCEDNASNGCKFVSEDISDAKYKKSTSTYNVNYRPATLFYNIYPTGEITINKDEANAKALEKELDGLKSGGIPVALGTNKGVYNYVVNS